jgi:hypothetical protein
MLFYFIYTLYNNDDIPLFDLKWGAHYSTEKVPEDTCIERFRSLF